MRIILVYTVLTAEVLRAPNLAIAQHSGGLESIFDPKFNYNGSEITDLSSNKICASCLRTLNINFLFDTNCLMWLCKFKCSLLRWQNTTSYKCICFNISAFVSSLSTGKWRGSSNARSSCSKNCVRVDSHVSYSWASKKRQRRWCRLLAFWKISNYWAC